MSKVHAFDGWAFQKVVTLDTTDCRGLVADLTTASILKRQAAFCVLASIDLDNPEPFLSRLGEGQGGVGQAIRTRLAKDLINATFWRPVPRGYFRALQRIGYKPLENPHLYRRLFQIFTDATEEHKAHALRFCGPIDATRIEVVDVLDEVLVHPEVVKHVRNVDRALEVNKVIGLIKDVCSSATSEALIARLKEGADKDEDFSDFVQSWLRRADRLPAPPFPAQANLVPLTTAAAMIETGRVMHNCLNTKIGEVALGLAYYYRADVELPDGELTSVVVELQPMSNGFWAIADIHGKHNHAPAQAVKAAVVRRFLRLGAVVACNPAVHPHCRELASHLGVFRYGSFETFVLGDEPDDLQAAVDELARAFEAA
jgi:hypothetical protein